jgi:hypothetical protein
MFPTYLPKFYALPTGYQILGGSLLLGLAALILTAVGAVAGGQVARSDHRQVLLRMEHNAVVSCEKTLGGSALNNCLLLARAANYSMDPNRVASNETGFALTTAMTPRAVTQVLLPVSLIALRQSSPLAAAPS